ncbi:MAG: polysaccharide biosynthesis/export family protein, partial [Bryobacteraceae bacterium]
LSGPVDVRPDGILSMPLIGEVKADGLTAAQLKAAIEMRLNDFLNNPEVDVQIAKVNSKRYFVYGGVFRPGEFPLVEATTIMDALSQVGGFKDFAKPAKITIQRGNQTFHFNYKDFSKGKNMDKNVNIEIENGDRIYVPE